MRRRKVRVRTAVFTAFMIAFFGITIYLTYYSEVVHERNLPVVKTVLPQYCSEQSGDNARYEVPDSAIYWDARNQPYLLVVRHESDIMGDRYRTSSLHVWLKGETEDGLSVVEGIIWVEPVIVDSDREVAAGMDVRPEE